MKNLPAVNPFIVSGATVVAPMLSVIAGQKLFGLDQAKVKDQATADAEVRRLVRNHALLNTAAALGLGYASMKAKDERVRSAAMGAAIGTAVVGGVLGAVLFAGPEPSAPTPPPVGTLPANVRVPAPWISNIIGVGR